MGLHIFVVYCNMIIFIVSDQLDPILKEIKNISQRDVGTMFGCLTKQALKHHTISCNSTCLLMLQPEKGIGSQRGTANSNCAVRINHFS